MQANMWTSVVWGKTGFKRKRRTRETEGRQICHKTQFFSQKLIKLWESNRWMSPNIEQLGYSHLQGGEGGEGVKGGGPGSPKGVGGHPGRDAKDYLNIWRVVGFQWCSRLTWLTRTCFATFHTFAGDTGKFLSCCILYLGGFACVKTFSFLPHLHPPY